METAALIVAAGMSSRMGSFKPMLNIGSISVAQRVIANFRQAGINKIVMITGFNATMLERHLAGNNIIFLRNENYERTQMFDSVKMGLSALWARAEETGSAPDGLFFTPVAADFGIGRGNVSMTLTICNLTYAFGGIATGKLLTEKHFRPLMILGSALTVGATLLLAISGNVWLMYVLNALRGFSTGLLGTVMASIVINNWFHTNTGMMTSIAMGCSGLASAVFSPLFSMIIARMGWRFGYTLSAILMAALYLPIILLPMRSRRDRPHLPTWVGYTFYPVHLAIIGIIRHWHEITAFFSR